MSVCDRKFFYVLMLYFVTVIAAETYHNDVPNNKNDEYGDNLQKGKNRNNTNHKEFLKQNITHEEELNRQKEETAKQKKLYRMKAESTRLTKKVIEDSKNDKCDWKLKPLSILSSELCGSHYKILELDKGQRYEKAFLKKSYRRLSLMLHPDRNPSKNSAEAFQALQKAYDCLSNDACKRNFDYTLAAAEDRIIAERVQFKHMVIEKAIESLHQLHYGISIASREIYRLGIDLWEFMGEFQIRLLDMDWSIGQPLLMLVLLWKGKFLLVSHALAFLVLRINYELYTRSTLQ